MIAASILATFHLIIFELFVIIILVYSNVAKECHSRYDPRGILTTITGTQSCGHSLVSLGDPIKDNERVFVIYNESLRVLRP